MNSLSNQRFHVGAYGILIKDDKILLIKKLRGAYKKVEKKVSLAFACVANFLGIKNHNIIINVFE